jgi:valyl-tRNA synthetase
MSKIKGNGVDPLDLIDRYGADATRFSLMQQAGKNQDIKYSEQRTELAGQFCNKLWNASRFVLMNLDADVTGELPPPEARTATDRWILSALNRTVEAVNAALATYDMDDATRAAYQFFWNDFCDWYVEMAKVRLRAGGEERRTAQNMLVHVLETTLRLLHPIIPFITEEIWQALPHRGGTICLAPYPAADPALPAPEAEAAMAATIEATRALRNLRAELGIAPRARLAAAALPARADVRGALTENADLIASLAGLSGPLAIAEAAPASAGGKWIGTPTDGGEVFLEIGDALDVSKELERIDKELAAVAKELERATGLLNNPSFVSRANPEKVEQERQRLASWQEKQAKLEERRRLFV